MPYKIAVATSDDVHVDLHFGTAGAFTIIDVKEDGSYSVIEKRIVSKENEVQEKENDCDKKSDCDSDCESKAGGCGSGHANNGIDNKVDSLADCRCLLCKNIGPGASRQLERKAITSFQIELSVDKAVEKIIDYYFKIDNHLSLKK
jgi:predicted Fe-Mo cluster-binding NifX family protein